jgi:hypothetical protein
LAKKLADTKALATRLEKQPKQAWIESKPVGVYVVAATLDLIIIVIAIVS